jgi:hypothetical protein
LHWAFFVVLNNARTAKPGFQFVKSIELEHIAFIEPANAAGPVALEKKYKAFDAEFPLGSKQEIQRTLEHHREPSARMTAMARFASPSLYSCTRGSSIRWATSASSASAMRSAMAAQRVQMSMSTPSAQAHGSPVSGSMQALLSVQPQPAHVRRQSAQTNGCRRKWAFSGSQTGQ